MFDVGVSMLANDGMDAGRSVAEIRALPGVNHLPSKAVHRLMTRITKNDSAIPAPHGVHGNHRRKLFDAHFIWIRLQLLANKEGTKGAQTTMPQPILLKRKRLVRRMLPWLNARRSILVRRFHE